MQTLQLYIEGQRIDLFKDENVSLTQSIKNVKDISKIFTDFSKTFSVPASKTNNKIFKHYYNYDIVGGFDARKKKSANIELNNLPFRDGKIKLEGVDLKNNVPHTYKITFFGNTVELKDLVGEDKLSALSSLTALNQSYDVASIKAGLQLDPTINNVIVPLITHTDRLIYNSLSSDNSSGNLHYDGSGGGSNVHGVSFSELKYALRLQTIIEAIESQYEINFSNDFFISTNKPFYNLFMWLHRNKGDVKGLGDTNQTIMNGWNGSPDNDLLTKTFLKSSTTLEIYGTISQYTSNTELNLYTSSTDPYSISLQKNGIEVLSFNNVTGNLLIDQLQGQGDYTIYIEADTNITFSNIVWFFEYDRFGDGTQIVDKTYSTSTYNYISEFTFDITQQIPEMKVIDFLSGVFKMFNLTAYFENDVIIVKTLDSYYSTGVSYDITDSIEVDKSSVNLALPFREINFQHEDTKTFLAARHKQVFAKGWGLSEYEAETTGLDGSIYKVKTPFAQMKYERLIDLNNDNNTTIQYGYFVDDNQESYFGKPLIFYPIRQTSATAISFVEGATSHSSLTTYNIPSNSVSLSSATSTYNMNFFNEINEYELSNSFTNTLFEAYYKNYITSAFSEKNRLTKLTAKLPLRILLNYNLADRFVINNRSFKINTITTNLNTGKSEIELLNDI